MKVAYLIVAHNNFLHLKRLIDELENENVDFYIHIDAKYKTNIPVFFLSKKNIFILDKRYSINWGGFSLVEAEIELLKSSFFNKSYDYFILLSGVDYPIKSNQQIFSYLANNYGKNFINVSKMPENNKPLNRVTTYHIEGGYRNKSLKGISIRLFNELIKRSKVNRRLPSKLKNHTFYAGSQWWCFHKDFVEYFFDFIKNDVGFVNYYKNTFIPDEMFFHTIIMNSSFRKSVEPSLTYSDWVLGKPPYPSMIEEIHLPILKEKFTNSSYGKNYYCFARKFNDDSNQIINEINLLKNNET